MTALVFIVLLLAVALVFAAYAIVGNLHRIANAVEAQNKHYGIGRPGPTIVNHDDEKAA